MSNPPAASSDVAFTPTVKAIQERKGSRSAYARMEDGGGWQTVVTPDLASFIAAQRSFFLATVNAEGQPYIQHRGGPPGFLHVLDARTLAFADLKGNRQFITQGNLADNARSFIFLVDYMLRRRIKIWGTAEVVEGDGRADPPLDAESPQGSTGASDPLHGGGLGRELPAAHSAAVRGGGRGAGARRPG
jgi:predicted pyridoxine 5'-phosphate oxidase superfamily flavin-nucleotide-binding protein